MPDDAFNVPASREDARLVMQELDRQAFDQNWDQTVTREMRRRLTGRLLNAGLSQNEIDAWIKE